MKPSDYIAKKQKGTVHVESLLSLCQRCLIEHRCKIKCVGDVPRSLLLPVLERCSAEQLVKIENFNPSFILEDEPLWSKLFKMDFPNDSPVDGTSWKEAYIQAKLERDKKLEGASAKLKRSYDQASEARKSRQLIVTDMKIESIKRTGLRIPSKTRPSNSILKKSSLETKNVADKFKRNPIVSHGTKANHPTKKNEIQTHHPPYRTTSKLTNPMMTTSHTSLSKTSTRNAESESTPKSSKIISNSRDTPRYRPFKPIDDKASPSIDSNRHPQINSEKSQDTSHGTKGTSDHSINDKSVGRWKPTSNDETLKIEKLHNQKGVIDSSFIQKFFG